MPRREMPAAEGQASGQSRGGAWRTPVRRLTGQALLDSMPNIGSGTVLILEEAAANARRLPALEAARDVGVGTTLRMEAAAAASDSAGPRFSASAASPAALRALPAITEDQHAETPPAAEPVPGTRGQASHDPGLPALPARPRPPRHQRRQGSSASVARQGHSPQPYQPPQQQPGLGLNPAAPVSSSQPQGSQSQPALQQLQTAAASSAAVPLEDAIWEDVMAQSHNVPQSAINQGTERPQLPNQAVQLPSRHPTSGQDRVQHAEAPAAAPSTETVVPRTRRASAFPLLPAAPRVPRHLRHQRPPQGGHRQGPLLHAARGGSALPPQGSNNITSSGTSHEHDADVSERASQSSGLSVPRQGHWGHPHHPLQREIGSIPAVRASNLASQRSLTATMRSTALASLNPILPDGIWENGIWQDATVQSLPQLTAPGPSFLDARLDSSQAGPSVEENEGSYQASQGSRGQAYNKQPAHTAQQMSQLSASMTGLSNDTRKYNCFLNVIIQCLYNCSHLRQSLLRWSPSAYQGNGVVTALIGLFEAFAEREAGRTTLQAVDPCQLREALANLPSDKFRVGQMDDAFEVMIALYEEVATVAKAAGDPKIIHESCGLVVLEILHCQDCDMYFHPHEYLQVCFTITAQSLIMAQAAGGEACFGQILKDSTKTEKSCDTDRGGCGQVHRVQCYLMGRPGNAFTIQLAWQSISESAATITGTMQAVSQTLDLGDVLDEEPTGQHIYRLRSVVCYYGQHYMVYVLHGACWYLYDDTNVTSVGIWEDVMSRCARGRAQASLLFFEHQ